MNGLTGHLAILNQIEALHKMAETTIITGLNLLDIPETRGWVHIKFDCPDKHFPYYSFGVEFRVTKKFYCKHLKGILKIKD